VVSDRDKGLENLKALATLQQLDFTYTKATEASVETLGKALPKMKMKHSLSKEAPKEKEKDKDKDKEKEKDAK